MGLGFLKVFSSELLLSSNRIHFYQTHTLKHRGLFIRGANECKSQRWQMALRKYLPEQYGWYSYEISETVTAYTRFCGFKSDKTPWQRRGNGNVPSLKKLFTTDRSWEREDQLPPMGWNWVYVLLSMLKNYWPTQNTPHIYFIYAFSVLFWYVLRNCFLWLFLSKRTWIWIGRKLRRFWEELW